jgi:hypothetical protein
MISRFCFVFIAFSFVAITVFTIYLRSANNRIYYRISTINIDQGRLKQQLWQKQLQMERLINPAAVSQRLKIDD